MLRSSILVTLVAFLGAGVSFLNQVVVAAVFGATAAFDAYLVALSLPFMVSTAVVSAISYLVTPILVRHLQTPDESGFIGQSFVATTAIATLLAVLGSMTSPLVIGHMSAELHTNMRTEALHVALVSWGTVCFIVISGFLSSLHVASRRFLLPSTCALIPYISMMTFALWGGVAGPVVIAWGMLLGYVLACIAMLLACERGVLALRKFEWSSLVNAYTGLPIALVGMLVFGAHQFVDAYWAPRLGHGALSYLAYAQRLLIGIGTLVIAGPSAVLAPRVAELLMHGSLQQALELTVRALRVVMLVGGLIGIIVGLLATPMIELIFLRGAFDALAVRGVAKPLPLMLAGMTAMIGVVVIFRVLFAIPKPLAGAGLGAMSVVSYFALSGLLSDLFELGILGIATAYAVAWWLTLCAALALLFSNNRGILFHRENAIFVTQCLIALAAVALAVIGAKTLLLHPGETMGGDALLLRVAFTGAIGLLVFIVVAHYLLRMPDVASIRDALSSIRVRRPVSS